MNPLESISYHELITQTKPPEWLIQGVMTQNSVVIMTADPFVGKTFLSLEMGMSIAGGNPFMGLIEVEQGRVLYIGSDPPREDVREQCLKLEMGRERADSTFRNMRFAVGVDPEPRLDNDIEANRIKMMVQDFDARFVVLDTLSSMQNADENDRGAMQRVMTRAKRIRETGCTVLILHHSPKPGQEERQTIHQIRGSVAIAGSVDEHLHLWREKKTDTIRMEISKSRGLSLPELRYELLWMPDWAVFNPILPPDDSIERNLEISIMKQTGQFFTSKEVVNIVARNHPKANERLWVRKGREAIVRLMTKCEIYREDWHRYGKIGNGNGNKIA